MKEPEKIPLTDNPRNKEPQKIPLQSFKDFVLDDTLEMIEVHHAPPIFAKKNEDNRKNNS